MARRLLFCTTVLVSAAVAGLSHAIDPIEGSLNYRQQKTIRLKKAPVGSRFRHEFFSGGERYVESYIINPDEHSS